MLNFYLFSSWLLLFFFILVVVLTIASFNHLIKLWLIYLSGKENRNLFTNFKSNVPFPNHYCKDNYRKNLNQFRNQKKFKNSKSSRYNDKEKNLASVIHSSNNSNKWSSQSLYQQSSLKLGDSYSSINSFASGTTDTDFYRDWRHSIDFFDFNDLFYNSKYNFDNNKNVMYI